MKITAVTPVAAAASPSHPDHARWVKEQTLKQEIAHHGNLRAAETANMRALERLSNRKRKPKPAKKPAPVPTAEQLAASGVTVKAAPVRKAPVLPPCGACRQCDWCKSCIRVSMIMQKAGQLDLRAIKLKDELVAIQIAAMAQRDYRDEIGRELPFSRIPAADVKKAIGRGIEWVCDRSASFMGQWR